MMTGFNAGQTSPIDIYGNEILYPGHDRLFETIKIIQDASWQKFDFMITIFDKTDFIRNAVTAALSDDTGNARRKYQRFLGGEGFFDLPEVVNAAKLGDHQEIATLFRDKYQENLKNIGLHFQDIREISRYYRLLFASGNSTGIEFWNKATKYDPKGQQYLQFGD